MFKFDSRGFSHLKFEVFISHFICEFSSQLSTFLAKLPVEEQENVIKIFFRETFDQRFFRILLLTLLDQIQIKNGAFTRFFSIQNERFYSQLLEHVLREFDEYEAVHGQDDEFDDIFDDCEDDEQASDGADLDAPPKEACDADSSTLILFEEDKLFFTDFFVDALLNPDINNPQHFLFASNDQPDTSEMTEFEKSSPASIDTRQAQSDIMLQILRALSLIIEFQLSDPNPRKYTPISELQVFQSR